MSRLFRGYLECREKEKLRLSKILCPICHNIKRKCHQ